MSGKVTPLKGLLIFFTCVLLLGLVGGAIFYHQVDKFALGEPGAKRCYDTGYCVQLLSLTEAQEWEVINQWLEDPLPVEAEPGCVLIAARIEVSVVDGIDPSTDALPYDEFLYADEEHTWDPIDVGPALRNLSLEALEKGSAQGDAVFQLPREWADQIEGYLINTGYSWEPFTVLRVAS
ncbi:MAG: hypothetical protein LBM23_02995 [Propionibacteriaceae bacterium]|jgi:hypothetical protein|nr:hypothetical protein [Propionibacteriaceae bacterium]